MVPLYYGPNNVKALIPIPSLSLSITHNHETPFIFAECQDMAQVRVT
ncbi:MAG: hypothetical protein QW520_04860 [Methanomassiliicoccales archaeon]